jgi:DNA repair protein RadA
MIDSPYHPYSDARFTVNERGTDDIEGDESSLSKKKSNSNSKASK